MSSTVTFSKGGTTVTVNGPAEGQPVDPLPRWVTGLTENGTRYAYKRNTATNRTWALQFDFLTGAQKAALESFFYSTADGPVNTFDYTHTDNKTYTARFIDTVFSPTRINGNLWSLSIKLEVTEAVT